MGLSFSLLYSTLGLPLGRLADRRSRRVILSAGIAVWSAMTLLCGLARSYGQLLFFRVGAVWTSSTPSAARAMPRPS